MNTATENRKDALLPGFLVVNEFGNPRPLFGVVNLNITEDYKAATDKGTLVPVENEIRNIGWGFSGRDLAICGHDKAKGLISFSVEPEMSALMRCMEVRIHADGYTRGAELIHHSVCHPDGELMPRSCKILLMAPIYSYCTQKALVVVMSSLKINDDRSCSYAVKIIKGRFLRLPDNDTTETVKYSVLYSGDPDELPKEKGLGQYKEAVQLAIKRVRKMLLALAPDILSPDEFRELDGSYSEKG